MAIAGGAHTIAMPLTAQSHCYLQSPSSRYQVSSSSCLTSNPISLRLSPLLLRTSSSDQTVLLGFENASSPPAVSSIRASITSEPNSAVFGFESGSGSRSARERRRFDLLRPSARPRFQTQQQQPPPRTDEDSQRPPPEPIGKLEPSMERYLQYLADYKIVYDTMEEIVRQASHPSYAIFWNSGLERSAALAKDFEWFRSQGHTIPQPNTLGRSYAQRLKYLSENDPPAFIYSVYNVFYAHSAGGRYIGRKIADLILDGRELNFYQFEKEILDLIDAAREKLDKLKGTWPKETRDRMLKETRVSYKWSADLVRKYIRVYDNEQPEIHEDISLPNAF